MNEIYRVVWCKAIQTFVTISEFSKAQGKGKKGISTQSKIVGTIADKRFAISVLVSTMILASGQALAQNATGTTTSTSSTHPNSMLGSANYCYFDEISASAICGDSTTVIDSTATGSVALGLNASIDTNAVNSVAIGKGAVVELDNSVAVGSNSQALKVHTTVNGGNYTYGGSNEKNVSGVGDDVVGVVSVGFDDGQTVENRQVQNVAAGVVSEDSTDAVNGSQLYYTHQAISANNANISHNSNSITNNTRNIANNTANIHQGLNFTGDNGKAYNYQLGDTVNISGDDNVTTLATDKGVQVKLNPDVSVDSLIVDTVNVGDNTVIDDSGIVIGGGTDDPVSLTDDGLSNGGNRITNVAPGVADTDAVSVSQLNDLDNRLTKRIDDVEDGANAGTAAAIAASSLPQPHDSGTSMVSAGLGYYEGESALAVGVSTLSDNGHWVVKGSASVNTASNVGVGVGVGYQW